MRYSPVLLAELLKLPPGAQIIGCRQSEMRGEFIDIGVSHHDLKPLKETELTPPVYPSFEIQEDGSAKFVSWNQPPE